MQKKTLAFKDVKEDIEILRVNTCGGYPGKRAVMRAMEIVKREADTIVFASCITKGNPIDFACTHAEKMKASIEKKIFVNSKIHKKPNTTLVEGCLGSPAPCNWRSFSDISLKRIEDSGHDYCFLRNFFRLFFHKNKIPYIFPRIRLENSETENYKGREVSDAYDG